MVDVQDVDIVIRVQSTRPVCQGCMQRHQMGRMLGCASVHAPMFWLWLNIQMIEHLAKNCTIGVLHRTVLLPFPGITCRSPRTPADTRQNVNSNVSCWCSEQVGVSKLSSLSSQLSFFVALLIVSWKSHSSVYDIRPALGDAQQGSLDLMDPCTKVIYDDTF